LSTAFARLSDAAMTASRTSTIRCSNASSDRRAAARARWARFLSIPASVRETPDRRVANGPAYRGAAEPTRSGRLRLLAHHLPQAPLGAQADLARVGDHLLVLGDAAVGAHRLGPVADVLDVID
jgi:hypothetical protein